MKATSLCATILLLACGRPVADRPVQQQAGASVQVATLASSSICIDSMSEVRAIACSGQTARRVGDTLFVRISTGNEKTFLESGGEAPGGFHYMGRIASGKWHIIQSYGHEAYPDWIFVSAQNGHEVVAPEFPVFSPDSARFATGGGMWDNCSEANGADLRVWRMTDTMPVMEWRTVTQDCVHINDGWGATELHWRSPDTLEFTGNEFVRADIKPGVFGTIGRKRQALRAVLDHGTWRIIGRQF